ncbi:N-acetyltransferase [Ancylomarina salipaludis]|uniref:N-acetyltransferase n=1 Tax=Ancylomarina salipaludis TaxID=2501299 RepID=A0A4Q1JP41_9BACT|nr:GNAT family protein [Ancylomarina salipaludis]RXQ95946.1 N-acetyltransferase [Ancylomarina salipaludis]
MAITEQVKKIRVSDSILLKQIELSDSKDIFRTIDSQRAYLGEWLPFVEFSRRLEDTEGFIKKILEHPHDNYVFVIHLHGKFAGLIGFKDSDKQNRKTEIGYWLSENFQKKGIVTKSVQRLCKFAFEELGMNRIQIKCAERNFPSKKIPKRLGFVFEGIERDGELLTGGVFTDLEIYSKLKND